MRKIIAYLFFPIAMLYGISIRIRNKLYNIEILKSKQHSITTIGVGNLRVGGTGKTPHIEHIAGVLSQKYRLGVLSRGYGRSSKGFRLVEENDISKETGDEPLQIKLKYPDIMVAVSENRNIGIEKMREISPELEIILLDDAFQHRQASLDISFLLTEYQSPFFKDRVMPFGLLREQSKNYKRADYIIITKTPKDISIGERTHFESKLKPKKYQKVFYSNIVYANPRSIFTNNILSSIDSKDIILITGIANNSYIKEYLESIGGNIVNELRLKDHYTYSKKDIEKIINLYNNHSGSLIITTEKDEVKLREFEELKESQIPIYALPITVSLTYFNLKSENFEEILLEDVRKDKSFG